MGVQPAALILEVQIGGSTFSELTGATFNEIIQTLENSVTDRLSWLSAAAVSQSRSNTMPQIELYTARLCPFAMRVRLALAEKCVRADEIEIDPQNKPAWFTEMSPNGKVPLLRHGENLVWESAVICEYLEEACSGTRLLPQDPYARAQARLWVKFADDCLYARTDALFHSFDRSHHTAITAELARSLRVLEREALAGATRKGPYWLGAEFSLADLAFYPWFEQVRVLEKYFGLRMPDETPRLRAWKESVAARETVKTIGRPPEFYLAAYGRLLAA